ncbi:Uncharacterised protein [Mycobacterium tuberculosis]|uniref:Uncharacterized protein n=1 Tax=Mycobacterium tuberculosis TaxID=1773 RepID=A0A654TVU4_MYCTX|nr:Uncharacterised protein [Mycobacterium tuberculosis]CFS29781.1 Uncharacterised protein [Mycobacterium tuberculosis]COW89221.1 Uncharacterised protein [Mycobacterium tuberculosis]COX53825.1 Uncharacterised protein [Mycobacterium tuberculosis]COY64366.1 Uncharacterised protein [Mycobacterium tuberculosis]
MNAYNATIVASAILENVPLPISATPSNEYGVALYADHAVA